MTVHLSAPKKIEQKSRVIGGVQYLRGDYDELRKCSGTVRIDAGIAKTVHGMYANALEKAPAAH